MTVVVVWGGGGSSVWLNGKMPCVNAITFWCFLGRVISLSLSSSFLVVVSVLQLGWTWVPCLGSRRPGVKSKRPSLTSWRYVCLKRFKFGITNSHETQQTWMQCFDLQHWKDTRWKIRSLKSAVFTISTLSSCLMTFPVCPHILAALRFYCDRQWWLTMLWACGGASIVSELLSQV